MPLFDFKCKKCGAVSEILVLGSEAEYDLQFCRVKGCGGLAYKQMPDSFNFNVNGYSEKNGYAASGKEVTLDDFDDAHKHNIRTVKQRNKGVHGDEYAAE